VKVIINTDECTKEMEVVINCKQLTPEIEKIIHMLRMMDKKLTGVANGETYIINIDDILYIESVDKKTFIYTSDRVYESSFKLYELEQQLETHSFFRANKSCVINFKCIKSLKADIDRRIKVTLINGEKLIVSRQYAEQLKERLGVK